MKYLFFIPTLFAFLVISHTSYALTCAMPSIEIIAKNADAVFQGRVLKVRGILSNAQFNKITIMVESPIKGDIQKGQTIIVYKQNWMQREDYWTESSKDKRQGLFILSKTSTENMEAGPWFQDEVYFLGMCGSLFWSNTEENMNLVKEALKAE